MYSFSIIHLKVTYNITQRALLAYQCDTQQELRTVTNNSTFNALLSEYTAYQQVYKHGEQQ